MREAAETLLAQYPNFTSLEGRSEAIPLADNSVDFIIAGQAYHWFDPVSTQTEFARILKPDSWVVLAWNERDTTAPFLVDYERMLSSLLPDYTTVTHKRLDDHDLQSQLGLKPFHKATFSFKQTFDFAGLRGRTLSSSYSPQPGQPGHDELITALADLFERYQQDGVLDFSYVTNVYYGQF
jgi:SAM-dependent methyltransferase